MRKVLVLFAHPGHRHSVANKALAHTAKDLDQITFVDLYADYPRLKINVDKEQERLNEHDVIVLQFPLMWYSTPSILKEWQDLVLEYGYAYGEGGDKLKGKLLMAAITAGGPEDAYTPEGYNNFNLRTLLTPLEQTANLCGMRFLSPYVLYSSLKARRNDRINKHVSGFSSLLESLRDETIDLDAADSLGQLSQDNLPILEGAV